VKTSVRRAAIVGVATALVGFVLSVLEPILEIEESTGLRIQYRVRGDVSPPDNVIVVAIDDYSIEERGLTAAVELEGPLRAWPREDFAEVITALDEAGAAVIVLDIFFHKPGSPAEDAALEAAIREAGSVILFEGTGEEAEQITSIAPGQNMEILKTSRRRVMPRLQDDALAMAPFRLPADPPSVNQYRSFVDEWFAVPQMPVVAFAALRADAHERLLAEAAAARPELANALRETRLETRMAALRDAMLADPSLARELERRLEALRSGTANASLAGDMSMLLDLYRTRESRYFNLYGDPMTITTVSAHDVLDDGLDPSLPWEDAVVLMGYSDDTYAAQEDTFQTFFRQASGHDISGVELAATAVANFIERRSLRAAPIPYHLAAVLLFGLFLGACFSARSITPSITLLVAVLAGYFLFIKTQFALAEVWWPFVVPLMIQAPLALVLGLWAQYARAHEQHAAVARGASRYLPADLVARISEDPDAVAYPTELVDGVCLVTDVENYTGYSESMSPRELEAALNAYYEAVFAIVDRGGGLVTDIVGDSMVAIWRSKESSGSAYAASIEAALEIGDQLSARNETFPRTRVGLNAGEFVLGPVGARDHLEYRAVGDMVNTASRIEALNKSLGTTVLAAITVLPDRGVAYRRIGSFQLTGKRNVLEICEPFGSSASLQPRQQRLIEAFDGAQRQFSHGRWEQALSAFQALLREFGADGPSRFYANYIELKLSHAPSDERDPVIRLSN
jgi:adenylate cyclase